MANTVAEVLDAAADLIEPEGAWTQGCFARGQQGQPVPVRDEHATCFCLRGALVRVGAIVANIDQNYATSFLGFKNAERMVGWNDNPLRKQSDVVAKLRKAALLARQENA